MCCSHDFPSPAEHTSSPAKSGPPSDTLQAQQLWHKRGPPSNSLRAHLPWPFLNPGERICAHGAWTPIGFSKTSAKGLELADEAQLVQDERAAAAHAGDLRVSAGPGTLKTLAEGGTGR